MSAAAVAVASPVVGDTLRLRYRSEDWVCRVEVLAVDGPSVDVLLLSQDWPMEPEGLNWSLDLRDVEWEVIR